MPPSSGQKSQPNGKNGTDRTMCLVFSFERIDRRAKRTREKGTGPLHDIFKGGRGNSLFKCVEKKNQLDTTEWFITLIICSTCFGHFCVYHQELETICVLLPPMVCSALVAGCRRSDAGQPAMRPGRGMLHVVQHPSFWTHSLLPYT